MSALRRNTRLGVSGTSAESAGAGRIHFGGIGLAPLPGVSSLAIDSDLVLLISMPPLLTGFAGRHLWTLRWNIVMNRPTLRQGAKSHSELALFLRYLRRRIHRDVRVLGPYVRLPRRLGKRVTQEELAEAIGVGREWYVQLECETGKTRASTGLLRRLADALMVTPEERVRLFQLAIPDV